MPRGRRVFGISAGLMAIVAQLASTGLVAGAAPQPTPVGSRDAAGYATLFKVSVAEGARRLELQAEIGALDAQLTAAEPATYAGLWQQNTPTFGLVARFTQDGPATLKKYVDGTDLASIATAAPAAYSLERLASDFEAVRKVAHSTGYDASINVFQNRIDLLASETADQAGLARAQLPPSVVVDSTPRIARPATDIYGGLGISSCTSGFGVSDKYGSRGIVTAGHCPDSQSYNGNNLPFQRQAFIGSNDEQFHTVGFLAVKNLIFDPTNGYPYTRPITSRVYRASQPLNGLVCKYGVTTGYTCGVLVSKTLQPSYVPNANATFMWVSANGGPDMVNPGDSGGPVFINNSAYGIVSGEYGFPWCMCDLIYTALDYVESGVSVTVLTQ